MNGWQQLIDTTANFVIPKATSYAVIVFGTDGPPWVNAAPGTTMATVVDALRQLADELDAVPNDSTAGDPE